LRSSEKRGDDVEWNGGRGRDVSIKDVTLSTSQYHLFYMAHY
jgi:hypothetical protein